MISHVFALIIPYFSIHQMLKFVYSQLLFRIFEIAFCLSAVQKYKTATTNENLFLKFDLNFRIYKEAFDE